MRTGRALMGAALLAQALLAALASWGWHGWLRVALHILGGRPRRSEPSDGAEAWAAA
jgi:hypothetical protein